MGRWLVKQEPGSYPFERLVEEGRTVWDGVRNYQARNNLAEMKEGEGVLYYHSGSAREVVGLAKVARAAYPDPTTDDDRWVAVDLEADRALARPVTLEEIKGDPALADMALVRQSRLSVMQVTDAEWKRILALAKAKR